jgi:putative protease
MSLIFNYRDANQGTCTNSCRWEYKVSQAVAVPDMSTDLGGNPRHAASNDLYYLEEKGRPGELMPVFEDEHDTYIMSSSDLRALEHVQRLVEIGVDCVKIEGRTKSHYYTARTTQVYRQAIDDAAAGLAFRPELMADLKSLANRGYTDGFYLEQMLDRQGNSVQEAPGGGYQVLVKLPVSGQPNGLLCRYLGDT